MKDNEVDIKAFSRTKLMWAIQALAMPAEVQLTLFPDFVCKADELALEFDEHYTRAISVFGDKMTIEQKTVLSAIDQKLSDMSASGKEFSLSLWEEEGLLSSLQWTTIRILAREALEKFGWPVESPPQESEDRGSIYVQGPSTKKKRKTSKQQDLLSLISQQTAGIIIMVLSAITSLGILLYSHGLPILTH